MKHIAIEILLLCRFFCFYFFVVIVVEIALFIFEKLKKNADQCAKADNAHNFRIIC